VNKVVSSDGTTIAFDRSGEGPPVIVVGGAFIERSHPAVTGLAALLAPDFTVYNYDRRGRGDSGDTAPYAVEREVEDLQALIREAAGPAFVFGLSSGAALALEAAASGLAITKLAVYEPPFTVDDSRPPGPRDFAVQLTGLISAGRRGDAVEFFMTKGMGMPAEFVAPMRNAPMWPALEVLAHTLVYDTAVMGDNSLPAERMAAVTVPTQVMNGENSTPWLRHAARVTADALPHGRHHTLEGQDHVVDPAALAPALKEFFAD
jgi:pimeloyl-ACP methyl ester carboxylesterase